MHYLLIHSSQPENKKVGHYPCSSSSITGLQSETTEIYISVCVCVCVCGGGGGAGVGGGGGVGTGVGVSLFKD